MIVGKVNMRYVAFVAVVAAVGGFLFGYDTAVISGTIDTVAGQFSLDALQKGWYVGCALVGSIFGVSVAGMLGDSIGRKKAFDDTVGGAVHGVGVWLRCLGDVRGVGRISHSRRCWHRHSFCDFTVVYLGNVGAEASRTACVAVSVGDNGWIFRRLYGKLCFAAV